MMYGLYVSATGVQTSTYRQDVIANNLANAETAGFKRDVALFQERLTEAQERRGMARTMTHPLLENLGGGLFVHPTTVDTSQGDLEPTGNPLDIAIEGAGFFAVQNQAGQTFLTRNGQFATDDEGFVVLANSNGQRLLGADAKPIRVPLGLPAQVAKDGTLSFGDKPVARIGVFDVPDSDLLAKEGGTLLSYQGQKLLPGPGLLRSEFIERSNVDPATELAQLMDAQRQLEANANMIRYQDQTLGRLVNEVGKIG